MYDVFDKASIYVLPSYREGTPRSTLEAMSMNMPVITTNVPGCRETVEDKRNGFLVKAKSPIDLAKAMQVFIEEPGKIEEMGNESRKIAEEKFEVSKVNSVCLKNMELI